MKYLLIACLTLSTVALADDGILMYMEGFPGSSEVPGLEEWINVLSVSTQVEGLPADPTVLLAHPPANEKGRIEGEAISGVQFEVMVKEVDSATPVLVSEYHGEARFPDDIELNLLTPSGETYLTLNYEEIEWTSMERTDEGLLVVFTADVLDWKFYPDAR